MKVDPAASQPARPDHSTSPQNAIDDRKPTTPSAISALRPRLSDWRAQWGAVSTQSSADQLNARLTQTSGMSSLAPIAGRIDCIAVLPAAATSITAKSTAMRSEGMECGVVGMFAPSFALAGHAASLHAGAPLSRVKTDSFLAPWRRFCHALGNRNNAKAIMTNPRAQAQETKAQLARRVREGLKRFFGPWGMFVRGFIKHPVMVGSIVPSSPTLIRHMLKPVDWQNTKLFVEYGPGVGTFCRPVLERMAGDAMLIAIDTNEDFIDYLRKDIRDSRFVAVHGSAADVEEIVRAHGFAHADYVLSGLPFSTLPDGVGPEIAAATHRVLRPGGAFLVYQFSAAARDFMAKHFARIDSGFEALNVLPCRLFWGWKD